MGTLRYLAYGSNLHPGRLTGRVGRIEALAAVRLDGWSLSFAKRGADGSGKCTLERAADAHAWGVVYAMDAAARPRLDRIEGRGVGYDAQWLELPGHGACYTYVARAGQVDPTLRPWDWYLALVVAGARHHRLPADYIAALEDVAALTDPDRRRAARHLEVLAEG